MGLDPLARQSVWQHVRLLAQEFGITILLTTHFLEEADNLCQRVAIMNLGHVRVTGSPAQLKTTLGMPAATLDDVFTHYSGELLETHGNFREISRTRRTSARLG